MIERMTHPVQQDRGEDPMQLLVAVAPVVAAAAAAAALFVAFAAFVVQAACVS